MPFAVHVAYAEHLCAGPVSGASLLNILQTVHLVRAANVNLLAFFINAIEKNVFDVEMSSLVCTVEI